MEASEFERRCVGSDRCDRCSKVAALIPALDCSIGPKLMEIEPEGRPGFFCFPCVNELEVVGHLGLPQMRELGV